MNTKLINYASQLMKPNLLLLESSTLVFVVEACRVSELRLVALLNGNEILELFGAAWHIGINSMLPYRCIDYSTSKKTESTVV